MKKKNHDFYSDVKWWWWGGQEERLEVCVYYSPELTEERKLLQSWSQHHYQQSEGHQLPSDVSAGLVTQGLWSSELTRYKDCRKDRIIQLKWQGTQRK